ncbi:MAG TPA: thioesterase family protein [Clostridia bacterium]|nr:thioesterase family protein [Clostridia bacterium]
MITVDTEIRVRYKETDRMGIVHHSNYYVWFEIARTEYMRLQGLSYRQTEERGILLPLRETYCKYIQGALYDDQVIIRTSMTNFSGARITMEYEVVRKGDNCLLAKGKTVNAITDDNLKPINIKKIAPDIYQLLLKCVRGI